MNAAQAVALPADRPRNRPGRRPDRQQAALYLVPSPAVSRPSAGPAADHQVTALAIAARPAAVTPAAARPEAANPATAAHVRLTRRGRVVVATAAALLVAVLSMIAAVAAQATSHSAAQPAARQNLVQVVVRSGQNLWSVAESTDPNADPRVIIQRIIDLNGLTGDLIQPGQLLWVPRN